MDIEKAIASDLETPQKRREWIHNLEEIVRDLPNSDENGEKTCPLEHRFADGMYIRTGFMPAGSLVVGKIHRYETINVLHAGTVTIITEEDGVKRYTAPDIIISSAGCKKALYIHEDCYFSNINRNRTDTRDVEELEKELIAQDYNLIGEESCG